MVDDSTTKRKRWGRAGRRVALVTSSRQAVFRSVLLLGNTGLEGGCFPAGGRIWAVVGVWCTTVTTTATTTVTVAAAAHS